MPRKTWTIHLEDGPHTVELDHGYWSGKKSVYVDGRLLAEQKNFFDMGSRLPFTIGSHAFAVNIKTNGFTFSYDLVSEGRAAYPNMPGVATASPGGSWLSTVPSWAWAFVVACGIIPVLTLGGAIPVAIGIGGAAGCANIARDGSKETGTRVALCVGVTVLCWFLLFMLVVGAGLLMAR